MCLLKPQYSKFSIYKILIFSKIQGYQNHFVYKILLETIKNENLLGKRIREKCLISNLQSFLQTYPYDDSDRFDKYKLLIDVFINQSSSLLLAENVLSQEDRYTQKLKRFTNKFPYSRPYKEARNDIKEWIFNKEFVDEKCKKLETIKALTFRKKLIKQLYSEFIKFKSDQKRQYLAYQLIQCLLTLPLSTIEKEFGRKDEDSIQQINKLVQNGYIQSLQQLKMIENVVKYIENSSIQFKFNQQFKVENIPNETVIHLLQNIENRIQVIEEFEQFQYVIIRSISDNKIIKRTINKMETSQVESFLKIFINQKKYDIIIASNKKYENISKIRLRYLNYIAKHEDITIKLKHPQYLISASLIQVKISNLNQCINLKNLYTKVTSYSIEDIAKLANLRRFCDMYNTYQYENNTKLLSNLLENNKIEYLVINQNNSLNCSVLNVNTDKLRYINTQKPQIDTKFLGNSFNQLFDIFMCKYVDKNPKYLNINLNNRDWVIKQLEKHSYYRYLNMTEIMNASLDDINYKCRIFKILLSDIKPQQKEEELVALSQTLKPYRKLQQNQQKLASQTININSLNDIFQYMQYCHDTTSNQLKTKLISRLYDLYLINAKQMNDDNANYDKQYNLMMFIKYLSTIDEDNFRKQFEIQNSEDLSLIIKYIDKEKTTYIKDINELNIVSKIVNHRDYSEIQLPIDNYNLTVDKIPQKILVSLFDNIENRILHVSGYFQNVLIMHNTKSHAIHTKQLTDKNIQLIEKLFQLCQDDKEIYDIILITQYKYKNLSNIRIRYLNYVNSSDSRQVKVTLKHPHDLISATLISIPITNIGECINLKNLCSQHCTYNNSDIKQLSKLVRLYSENDKYITDRIYMLNQLFQQNKLEYVNITSFDININNNKILSHMTLSQNSENLRYLQVRQNSTRDIITLDITNHFQVNLWLYNIISINVNNGNYVENITGPKDKLEQLQNNILIIMKNNTQHDKNARELAIQKYHQRMLEMQQYMDDDPWYDYNDYDDDSSDGYYDDRYDYYDSSDRYYYNDRYDRYNYYEDSDYW